MHTESYSPWAHDHVFGQDAIQPGERRTRGLPILLLAEGIASGDRELLARMTGVLADYLGILAAVLAPRGLEVARLRPARRAPRGPEVDDHYLTA